MILDYSPPPLVTICCVTYNQEKYIEQAINSFLSQKTAFDIEIIIHDDASTDNTQKIIKSLAVDDLRFNIMLREENIKSKGGMVSPILFNEAKGKYIAMCDGDDYWTDPYKLQKQVDFLENNNEFSMCFGGISILDQKKDFILSEIAPLNKEYTSNDILKNNIAHTCTFLFRRDLLEEDFIIKNKIFGGDIYITLYMGEKGKIYGMQDNMGVYRKHTEGMTNIGLKRGVDHYIQLLRQYKFFKQRFSSLDDNRLLVKIADNCLSISTEYLKLKDIRFLYYFLLTSYYKLKLLFIRFSLH